MKAISFRPMSLEDKGAVFKLFEECFGHPVDEAWWEWKYGEGPYKKGLNLLAEVDGVVAGHYGAYSLRCVTADGDGFWVNQIGDVMISPRFRGVGVGKGSLIAKLTHAFYDRCCQGVAFNYGCPSERHARLGRVLLDYKVLDPIMVWELDLSSWRAPRSMAVRLWGLKALRSIAIGDEPISEDCASLYQRAAGDFPMSIEKCEAYLKWRYEKRPGIRYSYIGIRIRGALRLWCVLKECPGSVLEMGELLFSLKDRLSLVLLLDFLQKNFPDRRLRLWCNPHVDAATVILRGLGFVPSPHREKISLTITLFKGHVFSPMSIQRGFFYQLGDFDLF